MGCIGAARLCPGINVSSYEVELASFDDVFVHVTAVEDANMDTLLTGQHVSFEMGTNSRNGRPKAVNLQLL